MIEQVLSRNCRPPATLADEAAQKTAFNKGASRSADKADGRKPQQSAIDRFLEDTD